MANFTPLSALLGGMLIGLSAALLWLLEGRIAGISGIVGGLADGSARGSPREIAWRLAFLAGMIMAPLLYDLAGAGFPAIRVTGSLPLLVAGGLLVGFGTRLGGGCTSGHGICGIARLSRRSLVATAIFLAAGFLAASLLRRALGA